MDKFSNLKKQEKGITLAVLIITIVVLLILAGVTIAHITGGDGIINQASQRKDETTIANEKQILSNAVIAATNESKLGEITENNLRDALSNKNVDIVKSGGLYKITFNETNNLYKMNENGEYFYWENIQPTKIYGKIEDKILYLRATPETGYTEGTKWNNSQITKVVIEEPIAPSTCVEMFKNCSALETIENIENLHTENSNSMGYMFAYCNKLKNIDLKYFDTKNVLYMDAMFLHCNNLKSLDLSNLDTYKVTKFNDMFNGCTSLKILNLNNICTNRATNINYMFYNCQRLTSINLSGFNTEKVENMGGMFQFCSSLKTLDLSSFKTSKLKNTYMMFARCNNLSKIYVNNDFPVENITNSTDMFMDCKMLVGGNGTKFNYNFIDKTYARIDDPDNGNPGYFTLKTTE